MMEERIEKAMEAVCDLCHWPYVYRDSEVMYAEKCGHCPMRELLNGEQEEKDV